MKKYTNVGEYLKDFDDATSKKLDTILASLASAMPNASLTFSYGIPTFKKNGKTVIHFAGYKSHIGLYPGPATIDHFRDALGDYKTSKGTIQIPLDQKIDHDLIKKIAAYAAKKNA